MQAYFSHFQRLAEASSYYELAELPIPQPKFFNWTADIFEGLHVAERPDQPALVLADDALRTEMGSAARAHADRFTWPSAGEKFAALVEQPRVVPALRTPGPRTHLVP